MSGEAGIAALGAIVIAVVDAMLVARVLRAWRKSRKRPHLLIAAGVAASYLAVIGACLVLAAEGEAWIAGSALWTVARALSFVGAALAYGLVGVFAASAFGRGALAVPVSVAILVALVALAAGGSVFLEPDVATPATAPWAFRIPFVALSLVGSLGGGREALRLVRAYETASRAGRVVDPVALGRMRTMGGGFLAMASGQIPLLFLAPHGRFDDAVGLGSVALVMLGALGFVLACVATWATPPWLKARWTARGAT